MYLTISSSKWKHCLPGNVRSKLINNVIYRKQKSDTGWSRQRPRALHRCARIRKALQPDCTNMLSTAAWFPKAEQTWQRAQQNFVRMMGCLFFCGWIHHGFSASYMYTIYSTDPATKENYCYLKRGTTLRLGFKILFPFSSAHSELTGEQSTAEAALSADQNRAPPQDSWAPFQLCHSHNQAAMSQGWTPSVHCRSGHRSQSAESQDAALNHLCSEHTHLCCT